MTSTDVKNMKRGVVQRNCKPTRQIESCMLSACKYACVCVCVHTFIVLHHDEGSAPRGEGSRFHGAGAVTICLGDASRQPPLLLPVVRTVPYDNHYF